MKRSVNAWWNVPRSQVSCLSIAWLLIPEVSALLPRFQAAISWPRTAGRRDVLIQEVRAWFQFSGSYISWPRTAGQRDVLSMCTAWTTWCFMHPSTSARNCTLILFHHQQSIIQISTITSNRQIDTVDTIVVKFVVKSTQVNTVVSN